MKITLNTSGRAEKLTDLLAESGIALPMPCGGQGTCGKCAVRVLRGKTEPLMPTQEAQLRKEGRLAADAHLGCQLMVSGDLEIEVPDPEEAGFYIPENDAASEGKPVDKERFAVLIDIGTTTVCFALTDIRGEMVYAQTALLNRQRRFGMDVISRIKAAGEGRLGEMQQLVSEDLENGIEALRQKAGMSENVAIEKILIAGNTTMLHLLRGWDVSGLGHYPFTSVSLEMAELPQNVIVFPGISAFVGADIVAGLYSLKDEKRPFLFLDLGTNAEMALVTEQGIFAASAAAGPAFEGGNISCGTGSITGAVTKVWRQYGLWRCETIGKASPVGICGSGLISCVAALKRAKMIDKHGTLRDNYHGYVDIVPGKVRLTQADIRAFQEAKAAVRSGIALLLSAAGLKAQDVETVLLAGNFGGGLDISDACMAGLLPTSFAEKTKVCGNTVLAGLRKYLKDEDPEKLQWLVKNTAVIDPAQHHEFHEMYVGYLDFDE